MIGEDEKYTIKMLSLIGIGITLLIHALIFGQAYYPWLAYKLEQVFEVKK